MVDITITEVKQITKVTPASLILGETCAAFDVVQKVGSKYMLSDATDAALGLPTHILLQGGILDEFVVALPLIGSYTLTGPTLIVADQYVLSGANPGGIAPRVDLTVGQFLTDIFKGATSAIADIQVEETKIAEPA